MTSTPDDPTRTSDKAEKERGGPSASTSGGEALDQGRFAPGVLIANRYRIVSLLGKGGMGEVYRAEDLKLRLPVALKLLPPGVAADPGRLARFHNEVRIARQVSHPSVCRVHDIGEVDGLHFLTMEYVDGEDLASLLRRIGRLPRDKAKDVARQICAGLAAAHDGGVLHRDLKPANVMIDGRGRARLTDFGLAVAADEARTRGEVAGTPAYMAPEQIAGAELSARTDVYALGLVLYELFAGQPAFRADTVGEVLRLQRETAPTPPSHLVADIEPAVERVILQCLEKDPAARPASSHAVAAALLGENALDAAIAAGETPSPEMVAAASLVGNLRPAIAWACLLSALAGMALVALVADHVVMPELAPLPKPPEALLERARDALARLGYREPAVDSTYGFDFDSAVFDDLRRRGASRERWEKLLAARPGPYLFYYRRSPQKILPQTWSAPVSPIDRPILIGRVLRSDLPMSLPGNEDIVLDPEGRLVSFVAVPPQFDPGAGPWKDVDWSAALSDAGLDSARLTPSTAHWAAPVDSDRKAAWDGAYPDQADVPIHVEAAAYHGRPVHLAVRGPRDPAAAGRSSGPERGRIRMILSFALCYPGIAIGVLLVRRNLRLGRGDRRGALRLAAFSFVTFTVAQILEADHTSRTTVEYHLLHLILGYSLFWAFVSWLAYLAMEPAMRRRWPQALISWSRLLSGRFLDPLVGRDVLLGALAGLALLVPYQFSIVASAWFGHPPLVLDKFLSSLTTPRHEAYLLFLTPLAAVVLGLGGLYLLFLLETLLRRVWLARLFLVLAVLVLHLAGSGDSSVALVLGAFGILQAVIFIAVCVRLGLLSAVAMWFTFYLLGGTPLTLDWSAWYAGRSFVILALLACLFAAAFHTSLGGKPIFGRALLED